MSYENAIMYSRAVPMPNDKSDDRPAFDERLDACNPTNFEDFDNEEIVRV